MTRPTRHTLAAVLALAALTTVGCERPPVPYPSAACVDACVEGKWRGLDAIDHEQPSAELFTAIADFCRDTYGALRCENRMDGTGWHVAPLEAP